MRGCNFSFVLNVLLWILPGSVLASGSLSTLAGDEAGQNFTAVLQSGLPDNQVRPSTLATVRRMVTVAHASSAAVGGGGSIGNLRRPPESSFLIPRHNRELGMVHAGAPSLRSLKNVVRKLRSGAWVTW